jgi:hypothetical protein
MKKMNGRLTDWKQSSLLKKFLPWVGSGGVPVIKEEFVMFLDNFTRRSYVEKKLFTRANELGREGYKVLDVIRRGDQLYFKVEGEL